MYKKNIAIICRCRYALTMLAKKTNENIFISESYIGCHADIAFFEADLISFTFLPVIQIKKSFGIENTKIPNSFRGIWFNGKNIFNRHGKINIAFELAKMKYKNYIIGTDRDIQGEAMAKLLQLALVDFGVQTENIHRVPLEYNGYKRVISFWDDKTFKKYLKDRWEDLSFLNQCQKENGKKNGVGRRIAYMLSEYLNPPDFVSNQNPNGTSTITYLIKKEINEI